MHKDHSVKRKNFVVKTLLLLLFIILSVVILIPLVAIFIGSFKPGSEIVRQGLNLNIDVKNMSLNNYLFLFTGQHSYFIWLKNSVVMTALQVGLTLIISAAVGYGFAAYDFKFKNLLFLCVLLVLMVPVEILMLPLYIETTSLGLMDTMAGVMLPFLANATTIFFFKQYIEGIPKEIIASGRVDGATEYGIFFKLILPVMKPAFAAMAILNCMNSWNNFLMPMLILRSSSKFTLPIGLRTLLTPYGNNYDLLVVGSVFSVLPILLLFLFFQKYFIAGMTAGSVKE